jgi:ribose 5-phosphate isomerase B
MKIAIGSDERTALTDSVVEALHDQGHEIELFGPLTEVKQSWPKVAQSVAEAVASGQAEQGILFCWTGTGVSIAANKVPGVRASLCDDAETARGARLWNDANVLCLSLRRMSEVMAKETLDTWFSTDYVPNPEDDACLYEVEQIERTYCIRRPEEAPPDTA